MTTKNVSDFFKNKVTIRLSSGREFRGLLSQIDNRNNRITLEEVEDLGNRYEEEEIPVGKKITEKAFQAQAIEEILLADKLFANPKKYNPNDFFDSMTEKKEPSHKEQDRRSDYRQRDRHTDYRQRGDDRGRQTDHGRKNAVRGDYEPENYHRNRGGHDHKRRKYEGKQEEDAREYR